MAITVDELEAARPQQWRDAADDALRSSKECQDMASYARDEVASTLQKCWVSDSGEAARRRFVKHAEDFEAAATALKGLMRTYDTLADVIEGAKRDLESALDYANRYGIQIDPSGRATWKEGRDESEGGSLQHAADVIGDALRKAEEADAEAATELRTIRALIEIEDPKLVSQALDENSPLAIALRLQYLDGVHHINVSRTQLDAVDRASAETGMSKKLLLAILWQEQQWWQNHDRDLEGPLPWFGGFFDWSLRETLKPDKSLGITHMKLETVRETLRSNNMSFRTADGGFVSELSDSQLTKYIEQNPNEAIRLSAFHVKGLRDKDEYGAGTDKQLFTLYAADTQDVREKNETYGDDSAHRGGDIKTRGENWDRIEPHIDDALAWDALSDTERARAIDQIESQTPAGHHVGLDPIYDTDGSGGGTGTGRPEPGTPSPSPNPPPTPPKE
ncbi:hypothetical protein [Streptomyces regalis]|uniref:Uncharacterized protein n=1 Tax=Streptomyces regalis TaxID=68262 RepID=A0A117MLV0_9ACTN|nr:hypothetical protein [Streptomyces regalis]KUL24489.1 hypothetical protein ADL12_37300 [Streptomyces regalis]